MLIGRMALDGDFLVDSGRRYLMGSRQALLKAADRARGMP
jgi:hypothetical protein